MSSSGIVDLVSQNCKTSSSLTNQIFTHSCTHSCAVWHLQLDVCPSNQPLFACTRQLRPVILLVEMVLLCTTVLAEIVLLPSLRLRLEQYRTNARRSSCLWCAHAHYASVKKTLFLHCNLHEFLRDVNQNSFFFSRANENEMSVKSAPTAKRPSPRAATQSSRHAQPHALKAHLLPNQIRGAGTTRRRTCEHCTPPA